MEHRRSTATSDVTMRRPTTRSTPDEHVLTDVRVQQLAQAGKVDVIPLPAATFLCTVVPQRIWDMANPFRTADSQDRGHVVKARPRKTLDARFAVAGFDAGSAGVLRAPDASDAIARKDACGEARGDQGSDKKRWPGVPGGCHEPSNQRQRAQGDCHGLPVRSGRGDEESSCPQEHERSLAYRDAAFIPVFDCESEASRSEECVDEPSRCEQDAGVGFHLASLLALPPRSSRRGRLLPELASSGALPPRRANCRERLIETRRATAGCSGCSARPFRTPPPRKRGVDPTGRVP